MEADSEVTTLAENFAVAQKLPESAFGAERIRGSKRHRRQNHRGEQSFSVFGHVGEAKVTLALLRRPPPDRDEPREPAIRPDVGSVQEHGRGIGRTYLGAD